MQLVCAYTFTVSCSIARTARNRDTGYATVTHYNGIHASCHNEAVRAGNVETHDNAKHSLNCYFLFEILFTQYFVVRSIFISNTDRKLRQPKKEWDGAQLRNQQTKCNNLFPLRGGTVTDLEYGRAVELFWQNQNKVASTSAPRLRLLLHDMRIALLRFAT